MTKKQLKPRKDTDVKEPYFNIRRGAQRNNVAEVQQALARDPTCINSQDPDTLMTALHWVGANRNLEIGQLLFSEERDPPVDPWIEDKWKRLPVHLAIATGNQSLIKLFHEKMFPEGSPPKSGRHLKAVGPTFGEDGPY